MLQNTNSANRLTLSAHSRHSGTYGGHATKAGKGLETVGESDEASVEGVGLQPVGGHHGLSRGRYRQPGTQARFQHEAQLGATFLAHAPRPDARAPGEQALAAQVLLHVPAKVIVPQFVQRAHGAAEPARQHPGSVQNALSSDVANISPVEKGSPAMGPSSKQHRMNDMVRQKPTSTLRARAVSLCSEIYTGTGTRGGKIEIEIEKKKRQRVP